MKSGCLASENSSLEQSVMVFSTEILIQGQKKTIFFFLLILTGYNPGLQFLIYLEIPILMSYLHTILWTSCFPNHIGEMQTALPHREINAFFLKKQNKYFKSTFSEFSSCNNKVTMFSHGGNQYVSVLNVIKLGRSSIQEGI